MRLLVAIALVLAMPALAQEELILPAGGVQGQGILASPGELSRFLWSDGSGSNSVADPCTSFASEFTAPSFCLNGLGTSSGSLSLGAVGSPTTQPWPWCENGLNCGSVNRQLVSASNYFQTASMAQPGGSFWGCTRGIVDAPLAAARYMGQVGAWNLQVATTGVVQAFIGGTAVSSSAGAIVGGASQLPCFSYHFVGAGNVNTLTLYLDGAQVAQTTTAPAVASVNTPIGVYDFGGANAISRGGFAMFGTGDPSSTLFARLASATAPTPQGTRGEQLTFARASAASCIAPDGSVTWLQPGRPCISGGIRVRPQTVNLFLQSEGIASGSSFNAAWASVGGATALADQATGPDGAMTADKVTFSATTDRVKQVFTSTATAYTEAFSVKAVSGTPTFSMQIFDNSGGGQLGSGTCVTSTTAWTRCSATSSVATAGHTIWAQFLPAAANPTAAFYVTDAQFETGTVASDPCMSGATSATCAAETASVPMPSGANSNEGCTKVCVTPNWTGSNPLTSLAYILVGNSGAAGVRFQGFGASSVNVNAFEGVHTPLVAGAVAAGAKSCFVTKWSASANSFSVSNLTTATVGVPTSFSGFGAFGNLLQIGSNYGGTGQPNAATISDIQFGSSSGSCQ